jgi:hypothetical protein
MDDLFCTVYVLSELDRFQIATLIGSQLGGNVNGKFISTAQVEIEIRENEDFQPDRHQEKDFLFYPIYLEIEPNENAEAFDYIAEVKEILEILDKRGCKSVAVCDFEDQLNAEADSA